MLHQAASCAFFSLANECPSSQILAVHGGLSITNSRPATRVVVLVTCLPTKLLGESGQQITLALLPRGWISFLLLTQVRIANFSDNLPDILF